MSKCHIVGNHVSLLVCSFQGVAMIYDITDKETFTHLSYWIHSVNQVQSRQIHLALVTSISIISHFVVFLNIASISCIFLRLNKAESVVF